MDDLLIVMSVNLALTVVIETAAGFCTGVRGVRLLLLALINCVTNPLVNLLSFMTFAFFSVSSVLMMWLVIALLETAVVAGECAFFRAVKIGGRLSELKLSLLLNGLSFFVGLIIFNFLVTAS